MDKIRTILNEKNLWPVGGAVLVALFLVTRLFFLDADLPPWGIALYQPIDEGVYTELALNYMNYGAVDPNETINDDALSFYVSGQMKNIALGNFFAWLGLVLIGDTYYGLRIPVVILNAINLSLLGLNLFLLKKDYGKGNRLESNILLCLVLYACISFPFMMSGRVSEPSSSRMLIVQLVVTTMLAMKKTQAKFFIAAFLSTASVFLVYTTNTFLLMAVFISVAYHVYKFGIRASFSCILFFFLGCVSGLLVSEIYYFAFWHMGAVASVLSNIYTFATVSGDGRYSMLSDSALGFLYGTTKHVVKFFSSNVSLYDFPLMYTMLLSVFGMCLYIKNNKDEKVLFLGFCVFSLFLQTMVSDDYIARKEIMLYPVYMCLAYVAWLRRDMIYESVQNSVIRSIAPQFQCMFILCLIGSCAFRLSIVRDGTPLDFTHMDKAVLVLSCFCVCVVSLLNFKAFWVSEIRSKSVIALVATSVLVNGYFSIKYIFYSPTFSEKEIMMDLRQYGNQYVLGEFAGGFTLYNDIRPICKKDREDLGECLSAHPDLPYFDYGDDFAYSMRKFYDDEVFYGFDYTVVPYVHYDREYSVCGRKKNVALFTTMRKSEISDYYTWLAAYYKDINDAAQTAYWDKRMQQEIDMDHGIKIEKSVQYDDILKDMGLARWEREAIYAGGYEFYDEYDPLEEKEEGQIFFEEWNRDKILQAREKRDELSRIPF